jgi:hypothetical protein
MRRVFIALALVAAPPAVAPVTAQIMHLPPASRRRTLSDKESVLRITAVNDEYKGALLYSWSPRNAPERWQEFVNHIRAERRFVRDEGAEMADPRSYLTGELLEQLVRPIKEGEALYRAVAGGGRMDGYTEAFHLVERMSGPRSNHCRRRGR